MPRQPDSNPIWSTFERLAKVASLSAAAATVAQEENRKLRLWMTVMVARYNGKLVIPADEIELTLDDTYTVMESYEDGDTVLRAVKR